MNNELKRIIYKYIINYLFKFYIRCRLFNFIYLFFNYFILNY